MNEIKLPKCSMAAEDDEATKQKREELRRRLLNDTTISLGDRGKTMDEVGLGLSRGKEVFESDLEEQIIPHIKLLVGNEEISFLEIVDSDQRYIRYCCYLRNFIHVASYIFVSRNGWKSWQVGEPSNYELLRVSGALLGSHLMGERIKLIIGTDTIQMRDIGKYLVEGKTSLHICPKAKVNYCGEYSEPLEVLIHIEKFLDRILYRRLPIIPTSPFDLEGWIVTGFL